MTLTAPHNGSATSRDAADRIRPKLSRQLAMVYAVIVVGGEVTEREIEEATGLRGDSVRPRLRHLQGVAYGNRPKPPVLIETCGVKGGMTLYRAVRQEAAA